MAAYRQLRAAGKFTDDSHGDVFLVVDGWATFKTEFEALEAALRQVLPRMLNYGVHLIVSANRWIELHSSVRDQLGTKLELRLGDPLDSVIDIRASKNVPELPGRGLTTGKLQFLGALPRIDGSSEIADLEAGVAALVDRVARLLGRRRSRRRCGCCPTSCAVDRLPAPEGKLRVPLGWSEAELAPVWHDFSSDRPPDRARRHRERQDQPAPAGRPRGDPLLHPGRGPRVSWSTCAASCTTRCRRSTGSATRSPRRSPARSSPTSPRQLRDRVPGQDITPEQLRRRDWWTGPEFFLLIDDYDLVASSANSPFQPLVDFLPQGGRHRPARRHRPRRGRLNAHVDGPAAAPAAGVEHAGYRAVLPAVGRTVCSATSARGSSRRAAPCC